MALSSDLEPGGMRTARNLQKKFLGLEKRNAMRKNVTSLKIGDHIYTRTPSILANFTENLSEKI